MCREPDEGVLAEQRARFARRKVRLTEMNASAPALLKCHGDVNAVVHHDERASLAVELCARDELEDALSPVMGRARLSRRVSGELRTLLFSDRFWAHLDDVDVRDQEAQPLERVTLKDELWGEDEEQARLA
jgi:hypothetical protein